MCQRGDLAALPTSASSLQRDLVAQLGGVRSPWSNRHSELTLHFRPGWTSGTSSTVPCWRHRRPPDHATHSVPWYRWPNRPRRPIWTTWSQGHIERGDHAGEVDGLAVHGELRPRGGVDGNGQSTQTATPAATAPNRAVAAPGPMRIEEACPAVVHQDARHASRQLKSFRLLNGLSQREVRDTLGGWTDQCRGGLHADRSRRQI
jgi:hypothetical protein